MSMDLMKSTMLSTAYLRFSRHCPGRFLTSLSTMCDKLNIFDRIIQRSVILWPRNPHMLFDIILSALSALISPFLVIRNPNIQLHYTCSY